MLAMVSNQEPLEVKWHTSCPTFIELAGDFFSTFDGWSADTAEKAYEQNA